MSELKATPGPWLPHIAFNDPEGFPELCVDVMKAATRDDYKLIAAAPELYEALETCLLYGAMTGDEWVIAKAEAALAKARGEG